MALETTAFVIKTKDGDRTVKAARVGRLFVHRSLASMGEGPAFPMGWGVSSPNGLSMFSGIHSQVVAVTYAETLDDLMGPDMDATGNWKWEQFPKDARAFIQLVKWAVANDYECEITDLRKMAGAQS